MQCIRSITVLTTSCLLVLVPLIAGSTSIPSTRCRRLTAICPVSVWSHCRARRVARTLAWWPHCWLPTQHLSPIFFLTKSTLVLLWGTRYPDEENFIVQEMLRETLVSCDPLVLTRCTWDSGPGQPVWFCSGPSLSNWPNILEPNVCSV